jgi:hypothetical protein
LSGSSDDPQTVWFLCPDGQRHAWPDDASISEYFVRISE